MIYYGKTRKKSPIKQSEETNNITTGPNGLPPIGISAIQEYPTLAASHMFSWGISLEDDGVGGVNRCPTLFSTSYERKEENKLQSVDSLSSYMLLICFEFLSLDVWIHIPPPIKTKKYVDATVHKDYMLAPDSNPR